ncbi:hypothetical protein J6524_05030 [Bradyrhizobium sp. WSM 1738]|uniref:hypothetical protein n=1 Tax=Bradyrhizobium hereditatis TaxID=2821405 RepID=UPI001CE35A34|nr:hypothetical protein [Bradyrhizobium hereditatis]MCA6114293.1 hypothetical protein [Bradyrhizobium hereditatis]
MAGQLPATVIEYIAYVPMMKYPTKGKPWLAISWTRATAQEARRAFCRSCHADADAADAWKALKIEGWRIVRVMVTA